jgi:hypothetical protein
MGGAGGNKKARIKVRDAVTKRAKIKGWRGCKSFRKGDFVVLFRQSVKYIPTD